MMASDVNHHLLTRLVPADVRRDLALSSMLYLCVALVAAGFEEYADEPSFKHWANQAYVVGIHRAYDWGYDWLPLYLYVAKSIGWLYHTFGFSSWFGDFTVVR